MDDQLEKLMDAHAEAQFNLRAHRTETMEQLEEKKEACRDARSALRSYLSEDTRRIDWLEKQGCIELSLNKAGQRPEFFTLDQDVHELARGNSLRATIDAAMESADV